MKVKWRVHERLLVTGGVILGIGILTAQYFTRPHFLLPKVGSVLLVYMSYLGFNFAIIPMGVKAVLQSGARAFRVLGVCVQLVLLSYLLGPVINFISFYSGPGYKGFEGVPLTFGFHPQPFNNAVGGWNIALGLILFYGFYALIRELIIHAVEKQAPRRSYRVLVSNSATGFAAALLGLPFLLAAFRLVNPDFYNYYFALVPPVGLLLMANYYWLFPSYGRNIWQSPRFYVKLIIYVAGLTAPFSLFLRNEWTPGMLAGIIAVQLLLILPISWFIYRGRKDALLELRGSQTELARSNANLLALRSQINPHFLFNALNSLYAIALREGSSATAIGIQQLGDMMRFMLHDNQLDLIPMSSELEYLNNYIAFQKLRVQESEDMRIGVDVDEKKSNFLIAPMLLIPFVENAFKHGISLERKSWVYVSLKYRDEEVIFEVRNSLHPALANDTERALSSGTGLQNVRDRLMLLYPGRHKLHYRPEGIEYIVTMQINTKF